MINSNNTKVSLNRQHNILTLDINGKDYVIFDTALGNPKGWNFILKVDDKEFALSYELESTIHKLIVKEIVDDIFPSFRETITINITDVLADDVKNLTPKLHVYGEPIKKEPEPKTRRKFQVDANMNGTQYRFIEDANGEFMVNNIRCRGIPLEINANYEVIS